MDTCADIACLCGNHECCYKFQRDVIRPFVYEPGYPKTEHQEKYRKFHHVQPPRSMKPYYTNWINEISVPESQVHYCSHCLERDDNHQPLYLHVKPYFLRCKNEEPNCKIKHPTHTHNQEEFCGHHQTCCKCRCHGQTCGHGPYVPGSTPLQKPICHPDRPNVVGIIKTNEPPENKECSECSEIFSHPKRSLWEKVPPPKKKEDVLKECHDLTGKNNCEHAAKIEGCCCRCCTCRGCPTCRKEYCHPCSFSYGRAGAATNCKLCRVPFPLNIEKDQPCEKHPSGCYFIPNPDD